MYFPSHIFLYTLKIFNYTRLFTQCRFNQITLRIRNPNGTQRIQIGSHENASQLLSQDLNYRQVFLDQKLTNDLSKASHSKKTLKDMGINSSDYSRKSSLNTEDGFVMPTLPNTNTEKGFNGSSTPKLMTNNEQPPMVEDFIDQELEKMDGRIIRTLDPTYCHHPKNNKCIHCVPLEPYDEGYLKQNDIKYLSFHSWLRKLAHNNDKKNLVLEPLKCKLNSNGGLLCKNHAPYPQGICSNCQPSAITLTGQTYRHIDSIMFENAEIIDDFLDFWRKTGFQRMAYLYGYYAKMSESNSNFDKNDVLNANNSEKNVETNKIVVNPPLGIQAVVCALYEPDQECTRDAIQIIRPEHHQNSSTNRNIITQKKDVEMNDGNNNEGDRTPSSGSTNSWYPPRSDQVDKTADYIARKLGLQCIGWIFTDLLPKKRNKKNKKSKNNNNNPENSENLDDETEESIVGKVQCLRNKDTYFLSGTECMISADFQNNHPNICKYSSTGVFGSKFVTVVVSGDLNETIHLEGYQISEQGCALVKDDCMLPVTCRPDLGWIKAPSAQQFTPDVYYKAKNSYGYEVIKKANGSTFPIDFLLINIPARQPKVPKYTFSHHREKAINSNNLLPNGFPIENRIKYLDENQTFYSFAHYVKPYLQKNLKDSDASAICLMNALNNFHVLIFLANMDILPMKENLETLLLALKEKDLNCFLEWTLSDNWLTLQKLIEMEAPDIASPQHFDDQNFSSNTGELFPQKHFQAKPYHEHFNYSAHQITSSNTGKEFDLNQNFDSDTLNENQATTSSKLSNNNNNFNNSNSNKTYANSDTTLLGKNTLKSTDITDGTKQSYNLRKRSTQTANQSNTETSEKTRRIPNDKTKQKHIISLSDSSDDNNTSSLENLSSTGHVSRPRDPNSSQTDGAGWTCIHCTFVNGANQSRDSCEVCGLPNH